ncbi:MAG: SDR family NAD(P)-dependent oxidoreductase, partial [Pseudolabrys sp.]|nr:SDR family NAD(P)-dependent oxidoreductase [Pseudolabrys sp.]
GGAARPIVIAADLFKPDATQTIAAALDHAGAGVQYLVNNAGFGLVGLAEERSRDEQLAMIDLNMRALTQLSLTFVDSLARQRGGILNVGSLAGFLPGPRMAVYYATKAFVLSLSLALRRELKPRGVRVCVLCPGPVPTEFAARAGVTKTMAPSLLVQTAEQVAATGYSGLMDGRAIAVPGAVNKVLAAVLRYIPHGLLLSVVGKRQSRRAAEQPQDGVS